MSTISNAADASITFYELSLLGSLARLVEFCFVVLFVGYTADAPVALYVLAIICRLAYVIGFLRFGYFGGDYQCWCNGWNGDPRQKEKSKRNF
jgi:hypothetical protein